MPMYVDGRLSWCQKEDAIKFPSKVQTIRTEIAVNREGEAIAFAAVALDPGCMRAASCPAASAATPLHVGIGRR
jgi:hypothetical protein